MKVGTLYTFGYATVRTGDGLRQLLDDVVDSVVDVRINRFLPGSCPSASPGEIEAAGYDYLWLKGLGNAGHRRPGPVRVTHPRKSGPSSICSELVGTSRSCLPAPNIWRCHRRLISQLAREAIPELEVVDL